MGKSREMAPSFSRSGRAAIDHRRPCASFDLTKEEDVKMCFHYTNLQEQIIYEKELNFTHRFADMNGVEKNGRKFLFKVVFEELDGLIYAFIKTATDNIEVSYYIEIVKNPKSAFS